MQIEYLGHADIDKAKWDKCIRNAPNGLIYGYSYYLDAMSSGWDALVMNDYETVMPLTWKRKFGIAYLYQPAFTRQLGIFSLLPVDEKITKAFLGKALSYFSFLEINLNFANAPHHAAAVMCNYVLALNKPFNDISKFFKKDLKQNVRKAVRANLIYEAGGDFEMAVTLYQDTYSNRFYIAEDDCLNFKKLCKELQKKNQILVRSVRSGDGRILATGIFAKDERRIYKTMTTTLKDGRNMEANHFLLHELIREYSGQNLIFDFSGSQIPSINSFLKKFGGTDQPYFFMKVNRLPLPAKWMKYFYDRYQLYRT